MATTGPGLSYSEDGGPAKLIPKRDGGGGPFGFDVFCTVVVLLRRVEIAFSRDCRYRKKAFHTDRIPRAIVVLPVVKSNPRQQFQ